MTGPLPPVLWIVPHPDDDLYVFGGSLIKHTLLGQQNYVLLLTRGENTSALARINGTSGGGAFWHQRTHNPIQEGYDPIVKEDIAALRYIEFVNACQIMGIPIGHVFDGLLPDDGVTVANATAVILEICDDIAPNGAPVRLKSLTNIVDNHPDHLNSGQAARNLWSSDPTSRFFDLRQYILWPEYGSDPRLSQVGEFWDTPDATGTAIIRNGLLAYAAWSPKISYAIGAHSTYENWTAINSTPKSLLHKPV